MVKGGLFGIIDNNHNVRCKYIMLCNSCFTCMLYSLLNHIAGTTTVGEEFLTPFTLPPIQNKIVDTTPIEFVEIEIEVSDFF